MKRQKRVCFRCNLYNYESDNKNNCKGRAQRERCVYYEENGNAKD